MSNGARKMTADNKTGQAPAKPSSSAPGADAPSAPAKKKKVKARNIPETGGPKGPEPTRYGDWERKGRCVDF